VQAEVGFDPCQMTHVNLRECMALGEGALYIGLATVALITMAPRVLRPFLAMIGDHDAVESLCVPEDRQNLVLGVVGVTSSLALLWWFTPLATEPAQVQRYMPLGRSLAHALTLTGFLGGVVMLHSLSQRTMDRMLGSEFTSLLGLASSLSCIAAIAIGDGRVWLAMWFPLFLVAGALARSAKRITWKVTRTVAVVTGVIIGLRIFSSVADTLL
jgi:hypothetical protein